RIHNLHCQIVQLKTQYNQLAPINRLPPELFTRIFLALQSNFRQVFSGKYYEWTVITQVSQSWRSLALESKQLWNAVSL
ncbi:hypothetical protein BDN72DRAFT_743162, partial [Pluteus cervinus]